MEGQPISKEMLQSIGRFERIALVAVNNSSPPVWLSKAYRIKQESTFANVGKITLFETRKPY